MRASLKWLRDYVDFQDSPEVLAEKMTMAGVPVETIEYLGKGLDNVVTGKIIEVRKHPDADRLSVCKLDISTETVTIVTGATNIREGQIVPVALPGAKLPVGKDIERAVFRGIESYGMLCSAEELGLDPKIISPELRDGIYVLPADTAIGVDIRNAVGLDDVVLEFELTANRADCFSMIGLAREVAVLTGGTLRKPMLNLREDGEDKAAGQANITIEEPNLCSRFAARILRDIKVGPSPAWMQSRLQAAGMRPINNIVDVTNFVMLEMGQPMHAYDYNLLSRHSIIVRKANPGERLTTLDGVKRELTSDMLVIADVVQAVGIAGVMGGLATEVTNNTQNVLLEAAAFNGPSIRRTSRALGLRSEASGRFERGVDVANISRALDRAAKLLEEMGACKVCPGVIDKYPGVTLPRQVSFTTDAVNSYIGTNIPKSTMVDILRRLEFDVDARAEQILTTVPTWRGDVTGSADIAEEVARIYGYNNIPATTPTGVMMRGKQSPEQDMVDHVKDILSGAGFAEIISLSFTHPATMDKLNVPAESTLRQAIKVINPITDDFPLLRTSLLGGIMETIVRNFTRKNEDLKIYELGAVYHPEELPLTKLPFEPLMLAGALVGRRNELAWNQTNDFVDFYDAKGTVEVLFAGLGINEYQVAAGEHHALHPGKTAVFTKDGETIGVVGEVHPSVLDAFGVTRPVFIFEIAVEKLAKYAIKVARYVPLPKFPAIARDLAIIVPTEVTTAQVKAAIEESGGSLLAEVCLFDVYTGDPVPAGSRSLAFALTFRTVDRTLTDKEVDDHHKNIVVHLEKTLSAKLRF